MKRREFLKWTGMTAAGTMLSACGKSTEKLIPYLIPPDDGSIPGVANYFATTCRQCSSGCGTLVRIAEGRAKKIEGNPLHPVNHGKLCARGQAVLQDLYHPDRVKQPMKLTGERGSGSFSPISWDEALTILVDQLKALQLNGKTESLLLITPPLQGTRQEMLSKFMKAYGSSRHFSYEFYTNECHEEANQNLFGYKMLPDYDIEQTHYILSFGADFLETYLSPVRYGYAFGRMRQARQTIRGAFTYAGARMSMTAASADRWLPVKIGQEGTLALGMAKLILENGWAHKTFVNQMGRSLETWKRMLAKIDLKEVSEKTGISQDDIALTAREFAQTRPSLALAGYSLASQTNGKDAVQAVNFLNLLVGNLGSKGGLHFPAQTDHTGEQGRFTELLDLTDSMKKEEIKLAMIYQTNPVYSIPPVIGFQEALKNVPFLVSFSTIMDDTAKYADLILPDHTDLESWGDMIPSPPVRTAVTGILQPVVEPLYNTRAFPEQILSLAKALGGAVQEALPYKNYLEVLQETVRKSLNAPSGAAFKKIWVQVLQKGGIFGQERSPSISSVKTIPALSLVAAPRFEGDEREYPLHLSLFPMLSFFDGRNAHLPWLQELPDPMTTAVWGSWVELNPVTAESLGIQHGDLVEVVSTQGSIRVPAVIFPAIRPDVVAVPMGQGHKGMGRYAEMVGQNPLALLGLMMNEENKLPAWGATRVRVKRISNKGDLVVMGHPEGSYRGELMEI